MTPYRLLFICSLLFLLTGCKKDLLYFSSVQKIDSHSDNDRLNKILFVDDQHGFIFGGAWYIEATILSTSDGGNTWQRTAYPNVGQLLNSGVVSPTGAVYATGFEGKLMHTDDTGKTWQFKQLEHYWFRDLGFTSAGKITIVGGISFSSGMRQNLDSSGNLLMRDSLIYQLNQIKMAGDNTGYICGYGVVFKTMDAGNTWTAQNVVGDNFMNMDVHGDEIWMCGYNGSVYYTSDGGGNWTRYRNGNDITLPHYHLMDIAFQDDTHGWAVGEKGVVLYSDDGGRHWMEYSHFTDNMLTSIAIRPGGGIIVVGDNGTIYKLSR